MPETRTSLRWAAAAVLAAVLPGVVSAQSMRDGAPGPVVSDSAAAVHLLSRATFGVRPEDVEAVLSAGRSEWLERQLHPGRIDDTAMEERLAWFPAASKSIPALVRDYTPPRPRPVAGDSVRRPEPESMSPEERRIRAASSPQRILADLVGAKLTRAAWSERQLEEVMTDFWFNHFNVSFTKGQDRYLVSDYERTAIRPYVFGRFEDMLRATARHPAMLFYLDNWTSSAPDSVVDGGIETQRRRMVDRIRTATPHQREQMIRTGRITREQIEMIDRMAGLPQARRQRGINENYARELMELHTLGVDGGYDQDDVVSVARAFTGWTFVPPGPPPAPDGDAMRPLRRPGMAGRDGTFVFRPEMHDAGAKTVLGTTLPAGGGIEDGEAVLHLLAAHPATARHIATKLVERFVADSPDSAFVDELAGVFTRTGGDLREVTRALFTSRRFYARRNLAAKVKSPFDLVASALRVTGAEIAPSRQLMETLRGFGELPYTQTAPTGFPAASEDWVNSGSLLGRMNFALALVSGRMDGVRPNGARLGLRGGDAGGDGGTALDAMLARVLPGTDTGTLSRAIRADLEEQVKDSKATQRTLGVRAVGLALGSPEFQRR